MGEGLAELEQRISLADRIGAPRLITPPVERTVVPPPSAVDAPVADRPRVAPYAPTRTSPTPTSPAPRPSPYAPSPSPSPSPYARPASPAPGPARPTWASTAMPGGASPSGTVAPASATPPTSWPADPATPRPVTPPQAPATAQPPAPATATPAPANRVPPFPVRSSAPWPATDRLASQPTAPDVSPIVDRAVPAPAAPERSALEPQATERPATADPAQVTPRFRVPLPTDGGTSFPNVAPHPYAPAAGVPGASSSPASVPTRPVVPSRSFEPSRPAEATRPPEVERPDQPWSATDAPVEPEEQARRPGRSISLKRPSWWPARLSRTEAPPEIADDAEAVVEPPTFRSTVLPGRPSGVPPSRFMPTVTPPATTPPPAVTPHAMPMPHPMPPAVAPRTAEPPVSAASTITPVVAPAIRPRWTPPPPVVRPAIVPRPAVPPPVIPERVDWTPVEPAPPEMALTPALPLADELGTTAPPPDAVHGSERPVASTASAASLPGVLPLPRPTYPPRTTPVPAPVPAPVPKIDEPAPNSDKAPSTGIRGLIGRGTIAGIVVQVALFLIVVKLAIDAALGAVATPTLSTVYGSTYDALAAAERQSLDAQFAAISGSLRGASGGDLKAKVQALVDGGMPRLDDATLAEHEHLWAAGFDAADTASCASIARATLRGDANPPGVDAMLASQGPTGYGRWLEILVGAMSAQVGNAPQARTVSQVESDAMFVRLFAQVPQTDLEVLRAEQDGTAQPDDAVCTAQRHFLAGVLKLDAPDLTTYEIWSVTPTH